MRVACVIRENRARTIECTPVVPFTMTPLSLQLGKRQGVFPSGQLKPLSTMKALYDLPCLVPRPPRVAIPTPIHVPMDGACAPGRSAHSPLIKLPALQEGSYPVARKWVGGCMPKTPTNLLIMLLAAVIPVADIGAAPRWFGGTHIATVPGALACGVVPHAPQS
jgi:hypothetical protein